MLHDNCITAWLVFGQTRTIDGQAWGVPGTTGDAYTEERDALRVANAMTGPGQHAWIKRIVVHSHC